MTSLDWDAIGMIKASGHRRNILKTIGDEGPKTPKELTLRFGIHFSQVSLLIKELTDYGLLICLNPNRKRGRLYGLTKKGEDVNSFFFTKLTDS